MRQKILIIKYGTAYNNDYGMNFIEEVLFYTIEAIKKFRKGWFAEIDFLLNDEDKKNISDLILLRAAQKLDKK